MTSLALSALLTAALGFSSAPASIATCPSPIVPWLDIAGGEGDLGNDTFQPFHADAELSFQAGAGYLADARATGDKPTMERGFELMREAIARSDNGAGVRLAEDGAQREIGIAPMSSRLVVGVEERVWLMLDALDDDERSTWVARFDELSASALARHDYRLCERNFPGTSSAVRAALRLADEALEIGRPREVNTWCTRALRHLTLLDSWSESDAATRAVWSRQRVAQQALGAPTGRLVDTSLDLPKEWLVKTSIPTPIAIPFENQLPEENPFLSGLSGSTRPRSSERGPSLGIRAGLVPLNGERAAIQTGSGVHLVDLAMARRESVFDPAELVDEVFGRVGRPRAARKGGAPGWPHLPLSVPSRLPYGDALVMVTGRQDPRRGPNALLCVDIPELRQSAPMSSEPLDLDIEQTAPVRTRWILSGSRLWSRGGLVPSDILDELADCEVQPGSVVLGDRLFVSVRTLDGEVRSWLLALDLATGTPLWKRLLAKGSDLVGTSGRFSQGTLPIGAAQALVAVAGNIFVGTHLGVGALVDGTDGRLLWSYKNRRRNNSEPGWGGARPIVLPPSMASDGRQSLLWGPADSDFLYTLRAGPLQADSFQIRGPALAPPSSIGESTDLIGANGDRILTYSRAGASRTLAELRPNSGQRIDSVYLRQNEAFVGRALSSPTRVVASTNRGLFLFDRGADLKLLDFVPLPTRPSDPYAGGAVYAVGQRIVILGPGTLWVLNPDS